MRTATWTLLPGDWRAKSLAWLTGRMNPIAAHAQQLQTTNAATAARTTGDILCLHDGDATKLNGDRTHTLAALEYWLPRWRDLGLEFVTMREINGKVVEA
jgi:peptidoglycan/xylan/chitin deacetylase (PgdA/CDA1 family)